MDANDVGLIAVVAGMILMIGAVVFAVETPGTTTPTAPGSGEPTFDYCGEIVVEGTAFNARINEDTYAETITESGWFSMSFAGFDQLSLTGADQVQANWRLSGGALDAPITNRDEIGRLGALDSERTTFCASKLPAGQYEVTLDLVWDDGRDEFVQTVEIDETTVTE